MNESTRKMEQEKPDEYILEEILSTKQINEIIEKWWIYTFNTKPKSTWTILRHELKPATKELSGFLGVHLKLTLDIKDKDIEHRILLFIKHVPKKNKPKTEFIDNGYFFRKEMTVYRILAEMDDGLPKPWSRVYLCNEEVVVIPDLTAEGFTTCPKMELMDYDHLKLAVESIARFHATLVDYQTTRTSNGLGICNLQNEFPEIHFDSCFKDGAWLQVAAKLGVDFLKEFSIKHKKSISCDSKLEEKIFKLFSNDCENVRVHEGTLNAFIHKDLWANNIMYRYKDKKPDRVILIDYQCTRIGPPAFDLMNLLYYNTNSELRGHYEAEMVMHYYETFMESLQTTSKDIVMTMGYTLDLFKDWCEKTRSMGILSAVCVFPFILMDGVSAKNVFDDPDTFDYYFDVDRSEPVIRYARNNHVYRERLLEACEEYYERYILNKEIPVQF